MSNAIRILEALGECPVAMAADELARVSTSGLGPAERALLLSGDGTGLAVLLGAPEHVMMQLWSPQEDTPAQPQRDRPDDDDKRDPPDESPES
ncbi:hypothetical protein [Luteimonas sp. MC1572]|uniref:hypothetical protein n=1 Tax=Luteimonas sp. MC1572 TaxID=2799325 RepID=UPI0018F09B19|nr:hypothetical protein [Luteimonas sp. MC1572]MBJ6980801.1 hypothetical protein [Luteimonas sp. MC1572]QQO02166.1 hypothetical protein JGR64_08010 [Luteimonas sp. MC1572]